MGEQKNITLTRPSDASMIQAFKQGNSFTRLSLVVFGLGNLKYKQFARGFSLLAVEVLYLFYMISFGAKALVNMTTLGTQEQTKVYNEALGIYEYAAGDNSMLFLLYGVITLFLTAAFVFAATRSLKSAFCTQFRVEHGKPIPTFKDDIRSIKEENLHVAMLSLPILGVITFTIVPTVFMILIAFTNYDREHQPPGNLFTWVGLDNFKTMLGRGSKLAQTFWPVLEWTLVWAVVATFSCFLLGLLLALLINRKGTRIKGFWRFMFVLSIAVPQFVSLLSMRTIFNTNGPVNVILRHLGVIGMTEAVPFFTNPTIAKITILCINVWIGVPFTMLSTTGILQNIPGELYEAAKIDGASSPVIFRKIILPYMLFIMTPNLITAFTGNINNFNVIYLLTGGGPDSLEYYFAGKTDILVTWLYRLTITQKDYNLGAVIGILVFIILAVLSLITYRNTGSYKDEGAFQ